MVFYGQAPELKFHNENKQAQKPQERMCMTKRSIGTVYILARVALYYTIKYM